MGTGLSGVTGRGRWVWWALLLASGVLFAGKLGCGVEPASIEVSPSGLVLTHLDQEVMLEAAAFGVRGEPIAVPALTWSADDPDIATVDAAGRVRPTRSGRTTVRVQSGGVEVEVPVLVTLYSELDVKPGELQLVTGESQRIEARVFDELGLLVEAWIAWHSRTPEVVQVDADGVVHAASPGAGEIEVSAQHLQAIVPVSVVPPAIKRLEVTPPTLELEVGVPQQVRAMAVDERGRELALPVEWASSDAETVRVSDSGVVTALRPGRAAVTALHRASGHSAVVSVRALL